MEASILPEPRAPTIIRSAYWHYIIWPIVGRVAGLTLAVRSRTGCTDRIAQCVVRTGESLGIARPPPSDAAVAEHAMDAELVGATTFLVTQSIAGRDSRRRLYCVTKRALDIAVASFVLLLATPVLLIGALLIKLDSTGTVIFRQQRLRGRRIVENGEMRWELQPFTLYKLRTMVADADPLRHQQYMTAYITGDEQHFAANGIGRSRGASYRPANDPRVTRCGSVLRKWSIDELPQLWNVVKGDMSLVGPRPPMAYEAELYGKRDFERLATPCGLTGWSQVKGRCTVGFKDMVELDLDYIARQSLWFDVKILVRTVPVVLSRKGAG